MQELRQHQDDSIRETEALLGILADEKESYASQLNAIEHEKQGLEQAHRWGLQQVAELSTERQALEGRNTELMQLLQESPPSVVNAVPVERAPSE